MKKQLITKQAMNNRANQLNPNNEAYWKSRMGNNQNMAKPLGKRLPSKTKIPFGRLSINRGIVVGKTEAKFLLAKCKQSLLLTAFKQTIIEMSK